MKPRRWLETVLQQEHVNFWLTNSLPRAATRLAGRFCRIEQPLVRDASMAIWQLFAGDLNLHESPSPRFRSVHDCFIRTLRPETRPIDPTPHLLVSPCDAIVGATGRIENGTVLQAKSSSYTLAELLEEHEAARELEGGVYVTLRLTASMYHRFHAPDDLSVEQVTWVPGALWNVNPPTVRNVPRVYCRNERAIVRTRLAASSAAVTLVAVGAVLVGGICVHAAPEAWDSTCRRRRVHRCAAHLRRGDEMGYFTHGSTIIVLAPDGLEICDVVQPGATIRMGRPLLRDRVRRSLGQG